MKFLNIALLATSVSAVTIEYTGMGSDSSASITSTSATAAAEPSTVTKACEADYIVERCLSTETDKVEACDSQDYDCQCAAYQAVATCYNNCPNDQRAVTANQQVQIFCQQASVYGSSAKAKATATGTETTTTATTAEATTSEAGETATEVFTDSPRGTATDDESSPVETGAAADTLVHGSGLAAAVVGALVALL